MAFFLASAESGHHPLQRLIKHGYRQVPYYRRLSDEHKIKPKAIKSILKTRGPSMEH